MAEINKIYEPIETLSKSLKVNTEYNFFGRFSAVTNTRVDEAFSDRRFIEQMQKSVQNIASSAKPGTEDAKERLIECCQDYDSVLNPSLGNTLTKS